MSQWFWNWLHRKLEQAWHWVYYHKVRRKDGISVPVNHVYFSEVKYVQSEGDRVRNSEI